MPDLIWFLFDRSCLRSCSGCVEDFFVNLFWRLSNVVSCSLYVCFGVDAQLCTLTSYLPHTSQGDVRLPLFTDFEAIRNSVGGIHPHVVPSSCFSNLPLSRHQPANGCVISSAFVVVRHFTRTHFPRRLNILNAQAGHFLLSLYFPPTYLFLAYTPSLPLSFIPHLKLEAGAYSDQHLSVLSTCIVLTQASGLKFKSFPWHSLPYAKSLIFF